MKAKFKKDFSHWSLWFPAVFYLSLMVGMIICMRLYRDVNYFSFSGFLAPIPFLLLIFLTPFQLTDNNMLQGSGIVDVSLIYQMEKQKKGVRVYYTWAVNGAKRNRFYPVKDKDYFITTLQKINPNIKLN